MALIHHRTHPIIVSSSSCLQRHYRHHRLSRAGAFTSKVDDARKFVADPAKFVAGMASEPGDAARRKKLEGVKSVFQAAEGVSWASCVEAALRVFHEDFYLKIRQLTHLFPADYKDPKTAEPFWTPPKRFPTAVEFNAANEQHVLFVAYGAKLLADNHGVEGALWCTCSCSCCL